MSKQKQNASANGTATAEAPVPAETQLSLVINFDDLKDIETAAEETAQEEAPPVKPAEDTKEQVLSTLETFEQAFKGDPLAEAYLDLGHDAAEYSDPKDGAVRFVRMGVKAVNIMAKEHNNAPNSYKRSEVIKKIETAFRLCGADLGVIKPQEVIQVFWVVKLDRSTPGADGERRSLPSDAPTDDWFGGNIKVRVLRSLAKCILRDGKDDNELDVWDVREGWEPFLRDSIKGLRSGELTGRGVDRLYDAHKDYLAKLKKSEQYAGLTKTEIADKEAVKANKTHQAKIDKVKRAALDLAEIASDELNMGKSELKTFLANSQIVTPEKFVTPQEYAAQMTSGDAKALVQELVRLFNEGDPKNRQRHIAVLITLAKNVIPVVKQIQSAQGKQTAAA
jgi:hypothetical protein